MYGRFGFFFDIFGPSFEFIELKGEKKQRE